MKGIIRFKRHSQVFCNRTWIDDDPHSFAVSACHKPKVVGYSICFHSSDIDWEFSYEYTKKSKKAMKELRRNCELLGIEGDIRKNKVNK